MKVSDIIESLKKFEPTANVWVTDDNVHTDGELYAVKGTEPVGDEISTLGAFEDDVVLKFNSKKGK